MSVADSAGRVGSGARPLGELTLGSYNGLAATLGLLGLLALGLVLWSLLLAPGRPARAESPSLQGPARLVPRPPA